MTKGEINTPNTKTNTTTRKKTAFPSKMNIKIDPKYLKEHILE